MKITNEFLKEVMPQSTEANRQKYLEYIIIYTKQFDIISDENINAYIAQLGHETQYLSRFIENLNYSAKGLLSTFSKYFTSITAQKYANKPDLIANKVYANRMGNGNESSGDGYKFRGRGGFMITGRDMYEECSKALGEDFISHPELLEAAKYAIMSSCWYFREKVLNKMGL